MKRSKGLRKLLLSTSAPLPIHFPFTGIIFYSLEFVAPALSRRTPRPTGFANGLLQRTLQTGFRQGSSRRSGLVTKSVSRPLGGSRYRRSDTSSLIDGSEVRAAEYLDVQAPSRRQHVEDRHGHSFGVSGSRLMTQERETAGPLLGFPQRGDDAKALPRLAHMSEPWKREMHTGQHFAVGRGCVQNAAAHRSRRLRIDVQRD
jgi:hypothetical protein